MKRNKNYPAEYKQEMVELYLSKNTTVANFCKEEDLKKSTFFKWLSLYRSASEVSSNSLVEVTSPIKEVNKIVNEDHKFSLKINNYSLEFNMKDLPQVLVVIKMVDLSEIKHIYIYPGITDMRLGIYGLRKRLIATEGGIKLDSIYLFCGKSKNQIKMIQTNEQSIWLYQNKLIKGKFAWPEKGEKTDLNKKQLIMILNCMSLISEIENRGKKYSMY